MDIDKVLFDCKLAYLPKKVKKEVKKSLVKKDSPGTKTAKTTEHNEQCIFFNYIKKKSIENNTYNLIFAIPNGAKRDAITGARLKSEGVKSGVFDIFVSVARNNYHGLYIEMKVNNNKLTENQIIFKQNVEKEAYKCIVCYSAKEAIEKLEEYLNDCNNSI